MEFMVPRDLPISLFDVLHDVDDLTQDFIESGDRIVRSWHIGRRRGTFHEIGS